MLPEKNESKRKIKWLASIRVTHILQQFNRLSALLFFK